jgi:hypothetical protein
MTKLHALDSLPIDSLVIPEKQYVTQQEYWEKYYHSCEITYEWNHGYLEEKGVSDAITFWVYQWFLQLLNCYLQTQAIAQITGLEMGFRLVLPHQVEEIRRPDLGIVLNTNPVPLLPEDKSYQGIFDLCIEAISDSSQREIKRDTVEKKHSYAQAGVKEYYILDGHDRYSAFYHLNEQGIYLPIKRVAGDIIQSMVLPGFQFRYTDLFTQPSLEAMIEDPVYSFVSPAYRETKLAYLEEKQARVIAQALAQEEKQARVIARIERRKQARINIETQMQQLLEKLRALGIDPQKL